MENKIKRTTAHIAEIGDARAPTQTPHTTNVYGEKATKDGVPVQSAMSWRLISNQGGSSAPIWEDGLRRTNDGVGGQRKQRTMRDGQ